MKDILVVSFQSLTQKEAAGPGKLGYYLAKHFAASNRLNKFIVSSKGKFDTPFSSAPVSFWSRYYLYALNTAWRFKLLKYYQKRYLEEAWFDFFLQFKITSSLNYLITINPYLSRTLKRCKNLGVKTFFIPANPEETEISRSIHVARQRWGIDEQDVDVYSYAPRLAKYEKSLPQFDMVIAHTTLIAESFTKRFDRSRIKENIGLIWSANQRSVPVSTPDSSKFKVAYLAHTVLLKGLQDLLLAWSALPEGNQELHIGGEIDPLVKRLIDEKFSSLSNVIYYGLVTDANAFFSGVSLFVCPSIIDAVPVTVLEAGARQIPSIITDRCGVKDFIRDKETGFVVPAQNPEALRGALEYCLTNPVKVREAGLNARAFASSYSMDNYVVSLADCILTA